MHFSNGQIGFIIFFVIVFAASLAWSYRKDKSTNARNYSGTWKVLIGVILVLTVLSFILKNLRHH